MSEPSGRLKLAIRRLASICLEEGVHDMEVELGNDEHRYLITIEKLDPEDFGTREEAEKRKKRRDNSGPDWEF